MSLLLDQNLGRERMKELMAKFLLDLRSSEKRERMRNSSKLFRSLCCSGDSSKKCCDYLVVRHRSRHTCDAEVCVGTVGRTCTATPNISLRGAHGEDLGAMGEVQVVGFIGKIQSLVQSSGCSRREKMLPEWNTTQNTVVHVHSE